MAKTTNQRKFPNSKLGRFSKAIKAVQSLRAPMVFTRAPLPEFKTAVFGAWRYTEALKAREENAK